jgi:hypothetical protein
VLCYGISKLHREFETMDEWEGSKGEGAAREGGQGSPQNCCKCSAAVEDKQDLASHFQWTCTLHFHTLHQHNLQAI